MTVRGLELLAWVVLGSLLGWLYEAVLWTWVGSLCGVLVWWGLDTLRLQRVLNWLKTTDPSDAPPPVPHAWRAVVERVHRLQKHLQGRARDSQVRLNEFLTAIQNSPNGVLLLDSEGRIEWSNETAADHLGIDPQRDVMQHVTNLIREPGFSAYMNKGDYETEVMVTGAGASPAKPVVISIRIHPYAKKRKLMLSRDVTAVQQAEAMRRDFVANVSHEIRTPLTVLSGFVETLQSLPLTENERAQYLALMAQQAARMETLVSDLLTLSKLEGSPVPNRQGVVDACELIERCVDEAKGLSEVLAGDRGGHRLNVDMPIAVIFAGNADELRSALGNLLSNAVRYTPGGGGITVALRLSPEGEAQLSVTDTGPGIAPEHIPRLTERFYRVDRSRSRETGGTGLGLAIVKHVVQRHGGQVKIDSVLGQGSTFTLHLPADRVKPTVSSPSSKEWH